MSIILDVSSTGPSREEVLLAVERVLASRGFRDAHQLRAFLSYVVEETLAGRSEGLKESLIGHTVFARKPDYDPRRDGIVRVQATALRKRLEAYYVSEGAADPVIIELPRGGYVPHFHRLGTAPPPTITTATNSPWIRPAVAGFAAGLLVAALVCAVLFWPSRTPSIPLPAIWQPFVQNGAPSLVGFGVPLFYGGGGIYIRDVQVNEAGQEAEGRIFDEAERLGIRVTPVDDLYTGVGEAAATQAVSDFLRTRGVQVRAANARTLGLSDLKSHNVVIISSLRFRTLLGDLKLPQDFVFAPQAPSPDRILNSRPLAGDRSEYVFTIGGGVGTSYAIVTVWPGPDGKKRIMHIGGVHTWATQAAAEFLLTEKSSRKLADALTADKPAKHGPKSPYLQVLLRVEGRGNQYQTVEYVTHHYLNVATPPTLP